MVLIVDVFKGISNISIMDIYDCKYGHFGGCNSYCFFILNINIMNVFVMELMICHKYFCGGINEWFYGHFSYYKNNTKFHSIT